MNVPICFVDTETTDISHRRLAWEMAIIRREPDGRRNELQAFIEIDLSDANPFALGVGRFYERHPIGKWMAGGITGHPGNHMGLPAATGFHGGIDSITDAYLTQDQAAALWCRWTHGAHVVGAVPNFDTEVMGAAARAAGLTAAHHYHLIAVDRVEHSWLWWLGRLLIPGRIRSAACIARGEHRPELVDLGRAKICFKCGAW